VLGGWRNCITRSCKYNHNYQVKENEVGGACNSNGGEEECL
jgi:hypothetical protein